MKRMRILWKLSISWQNWWYVAECSHSFNYFWCITQKQKLAQPKGITIFQNLLKWCVLKIFRQFCCSCDEVSRVVLGIAWKSNVDTGYAMCIVVWWLLSIWTPDHTGSHGPWLYSSAMWSGIDQHHLLWDYSDVILHWEITFILYCTEASGFKSTELSSQICNNSDKLPFFGSRNDQFHAINNVERVNIAW